MGNITPITIADNAPPLAESQRGYAGKPFIPVTDMFILPGWVYERVARWATIDRIFYCPIRIDRTTRFKGLEFYIEAAGAGSEIEVAIYNWIEGRPGTMIVYGGVVDASTIGSKLAVVDFILTPGYYFIASRKTGAVNHNVSGYKMSSSLAEYPVAGTHINVTVQYQYVFGYVDGTMTDPARPPTNWGNYEMDMIMIRLQMA